MSTNPHFEPLLRPTRWPADRRIAPVLSALASALALAACGGGADSSSTPDATAAAAPKEAQALQAKPTAALATGRARHTATRLADGKVLACGGVARGAYDAQALASCELYDPATNRWSSVASMNQGRDKAQAVLLKDGRVLMTGGMAGWINGNEIYDPKTDRWTYTGPAFSGRLEHTATLMADGRVLVTGGDGSFVALDTVEIYDPAQDKWTQAAPMPVAHNRHSAALLADGRILVAGFHLYRSPGNEATASDGNITVYDPASNQWTTLATLNEQDAFGMVAAMSNGTVVTSRGRYAIANGKWTLSKTLPGDRAPDAARVELADGRVVAAGGGQAFAYLYGVEHSARVDVYLPGTKSWRGGRSLATLRSEHTLTLLGNGKILVVGGRESPSAYQIPGEFSRFQFNGAAALGSTELIDPAAHLQAEAKTLDFDGDGKSEILWQTSKSDKLALWQMDGLDRLSSKSISGPGTSLLSVGDNNADGRADLAWGDPVAQTVQLWLFQAHGAIAKRVVIESVAAPQFKLADLNGDGRADLLQLQGNSPYVRTNHPDDTPENFSSVSPAETVSAIGDFNGDGRADLVVQDSRDGSLSIWLMNGWRRAADPIVISTNRTQLAVAAPDLDGDGTADLLVRDTNSGATAAWMMDGTSVRSKTTLLKSAYWNVAATPDLDGDGKDDILWYRAGNGATTGWLINGTQVVASKPLLKHSAWVPVTP